METASSINKSFFDTLEFIITAECQDVCNVYQDCAYDINNDLRCSNLSGENEKIALCLTKNITPVEANNAIALFRGIEAPYQYCQNHNLQATMKDLAFVSTSFDRDVASKFISSGDANQYERCCLFHIHIPPGQTIQMIPIYKVCHSCFNCENEVVLLPHSIFNVITDQKTLDSIRNTWNYTSCDEPCHYINNFTDKDTLCKFDFTTFKYTSKNHNTYHVVPVTLDQTKNTHTLTHGQSGGKVSVKKMEYFLGKYRKVHKLGDSSFFRL
jgi:hypothetical protein